MLPCHLRSKPIWEQIGKTERWALVDHELSHCHAEADEEGAVKLTCLPHDLEEFAPIVQQHGAWRDSVKRLLEAGQNPQAALVFEEPLG